MNNLHEKPGIPEKEVSVLLTDEVIMTVQEVWPEVVARFESFLSGSDASPSVQELGEDAHALSEVILAIIALELIRSPVFLPQDQSSRMKEHLLSRVSEINPEFSTVLSGYLSAAETKKGDSGGSVGTNSAGEVSALLDEPEYRYNVRTDGVASMLVGRLNKEGDMLYCMIRNWLAGIPSILERMVEEHMLIPGK